jgi:hypothetical protein
MSEVIANPFENLDADMIASIIGGAKKERDDREAARSAGGNYIPTGYMAPGSSLIRIFLDPTRKLMRRVKTFKLSAPFRRVMDPRFFDGGPDGAGTVFEKDVIEQIWELSKGLGFDNDGMYSRYEVLVYIQLISADKADDKYWKPGTTYLLAANGKFEDALIMQLASLAKNVPAEMAKALNPLSDGWAFEMNVVKGAQGSVQLTPTFGKDYPKLGEALPENYLPLAEQYVSDVVKSEDLIGIIEALKASRIETGLDTGEDDGDKAPKAPGAEGKADPDAAGSSENPKGDAASSPAADAPKSDEPTAAQLAIEAAQRESAAANLKAATDASLVKSDEANDVGAEETYGLTPEQQTAAKAAGMTFKKFADILAS